MSNDKLTEVLPVTRVTPSLRERLERIAATSVTPRVSDHIRYAVERYIENEEIKTGLRSSIAVVSGTASTTAALTAE